MDYFYGKHVLNLGVDHTQNVRVAAILDFCYNMEHMDHAIYKQQLRNVNENK